MTANVWFSWLNLATLLFGAAAATFGQATRAMHRARERYETARRDFDTATEMLHAAAVTMFDPPPRCEQCGQDLTDEAGGFICGHEPF